MVAGCQHGSSSSHCVLVGAFGTARSGVAHRIEAIAKTNAASQAVRALTMHA